MKQQLAISLPIDLVHVCREMKLFKFVMQHVNLIGKCLYIQVLHSNFSCATRNSSRLYMCATEETICI